MIVTIIGVGLIGGSAALTLRKSGFAQKIIGVEANEQNAKLAVELGIVDEVLDLKTAVEKSDLVILSIPVDRAKVVIKEVLDFAPKNAVVVDMGSTKSGICGAVANHPKRSQFVASHPIAGTEFSGPTAAIDNLFEGKITIICEREKSAERAVELVEKMYQQLAMQIIYMEPERHDRHIAFVSHISHISSFALGLTVLDIEKDEDTIFQMAGSGFGSTVRLAKSSPDTWTPILLQNAESISFALENYIEKLQEFKATIENADREKLYSLMSDANDIKRIVK